MILELLNLSIQLLRNHATIRDDDILYGSVMRASSSLLNCSEERRERKLWTFISKSVREKDVWVREKKEWNKKKEKAKIDRKKVRQLDWQTARIWRNISVEINWNNLPGVRTLVRSYKSLETIIGTTDTPSSFNESCTSSLATCLHPPSI